MVWELTLKPRAIEMEFSQQRGFYTRVPTPVAFSVCRSSRESVLNHYNICFGNNLFPARTLFNLKLDTLLISPALQYHTLHFYVSLKESELNQIRFVAIDSDVDEDVGFGRMDTDAIEEFKKMLPVMPALQDFRIILNLEYWGEGGQNAGTGPMEIYEEWPEKLMAQHACCDCCDPDCTGAGSDHDEDSDVEYDADYTCAYHELPDFSRELQGVATPSSGGIWGWRPTKD